MAFVVGCNGGEAYSRGEDSLLLVNPTRRRFVVCEDLLLPRVFRETLLSVLFDVFKVGGLDDLQCSSLGVDGIAVVVVGVGSDVGAVHVGGAVRDGEPHGAGGGLRLGRDEVAARVQGHPSSLPLRE